MNSEAYTVWSGEYEDIEFHGIFSSPEKAEEYIMENWRDWYTRCWIECHTIDIGEDACVDNFVKSWRIIGYSGKEKQLELVYNSYN